MCFLGFLLCASSRMELLALLLVLISFGIDACLPERGRGKLVVI